MAKIKDDPELERISQEMIHKGKVKNIVIGIGVALFSLAIFAGVAYLLASLVTVFTKLFSAASVGFLFSHIPFPL